MSKSTLKAILSNVHVTKQPATFTPGYTRSDGKEISARCVLNVLGNQLMGSGEKLVSVRLVFWGKAATSIALSASPGKELRYVEGNIESYTGFLFNQDGSVRIGADGQPIKTTKHAINVTDFTYGNDSPKTIADEIARGVRPAGYNVPGSPDAQRWAQILEARRNMTYDGTSEKFVYARVRKPNIAAPAATSMAGYAQSRLANQVAAATDLF